MKWIFYVIVLAYMGYRAVYGARASTEISVEKINYGNDTFLRAGVRRAINCRASSKNQRLEWFDESGKSIRRVPTNRVFAQEHFVTNPNGGRAPALALVFSELLVKDTGTYECRSGSNVQAVPLCVIQPAEFVDTPTEVTTSLGRSITLTCQAKGDPEPNIIWSRNSEEISEENNSSKYKVNTKYNSQGFESLLTITSLEVEDSGLYNCVSLQGSPESSCSHAEILNITLQISHGPLFLNGNDTKAVYGEANDIVDLVCSASGYPAPTYRWFKAMDGDTLAEFDKNQIKYSEEENQAVLSVTAGPTTFGQTYKCMATNKHGEAEKYYTMYKIKKPEKPSKVKFSDSTYNQVELSVIWNTEVNFPVDGFQVQYLKAKRKPKDFDWRKAADTYIDVEEDYDEDSGFTVTIKDLEEDTTYWVRVRPKNNAGYGAWSDSTVAETEIKSEEPEEVETEEGEEADEPVAAEMSSDGAVYGIFFAGGIVVVALGCMFIMRLV